MAIRISAATTSTRRIVDWLIEEFKKEEGLDLQRQGQRDGAAAAARRGGAGQDRAVDHQETEINLPFITADATGRSTW